VRAGARGAYVWCAPPMPSGGRHPWHNISTRGVCGTESLLKGNGLELLPCLRPPASR
jgi:hypothetical protein